jgi:hypothetical protein
MLKIENEKNKRFSDFCKKFKNFSEIFDFFKKIFKIFISVLKFSFLFIRMFYQKISKYIPIFKNFRATNRKKAFLLNALCGALITIIAIETKSALDRIPTLEKIPAAKAFITMIATFISALIVYVILYILFGFGGGMLA